MDTLLLLEKYQKMPAKDLVRAYHQRDDYVHEAQVVIEEAVAERGGIDHLQSLLAAEAVEVMQREKLRARFQNHFQAGTAYDLATIAENLEQLSAEQIAVIEQEERAKWTQLAHQRRITPASIAGGSLGAVAGMLVGGSIWGLAITYSDRFFTFIPIAIALICFGFVWLFSRKGSRNWMTLVLTGVSFGGAMALGIYFAKTWLVSKTG